MKTALACIACLGALCLASHVTTCAEATNLINAAAPHGRIVGTVAEEGDDSRRLNDVPVVLEGTAIWETTRGNGQFAFEAVPVGIYRLIARFVAHEPQVVENVAVDPNGTTEIRFCLKRQIRSIVPVVHLRCGEHPAGTGRARVFVDASEPAKSAPVDTNRLAILPKMTRLRGNTPNPFNPATTILFDVAEKARVEMRIYDVRGRLVRQLLNAEHEPGSHTVVWDGKTTAGRPVASSIYFLHMQAGSVSMSRRLMVVR